MRILVTGGAGYIGSHTCVQLLEENHEVVVVDNLINSSTEAIKRVEQLTNKKISFYNIDLINKDDVDKVFSKEKIDAVIHFAGLKAVGESVLNPLLYYNNNIVSTLNICQMMKKYGVFTIVFSSSATVYGNCKNVPIKETEEKKEIVSPYGKTKSMIEDILIDIQKANQIRNVIILRYFNPIGAHKSGLIGEDPRGIPNNLLPYISQVAIGKREKLYVFGDDYDTIDGTGVRDYIHVEDLARGHILALDKLKDDSGISIFNLGTGKGTSVLEVIKAFEKASGISVPYEICERRPGDIDKYYADVEKAKKVLNWEAKYNIYDMCLDTWRWQKNNPNGYNE